MLTTKAQQFKCDSNKHRQATKNKK